MNKLVKAEKMWCNQNLQFGLTEQVQRMLACENAQFIIDLAREMKITYTIPSISLQLSIAFFHRKSYLHYDRFVILTACMLLASKLKSLQCRIKSLCNSFHNVISRLRHSMGPFNEDKMRKIKDQISIYECEILRTLQFDIQVVTPHEYAIKECELLFGYDKELLKRIYSTTRVIILDSYRACCSIVYSPLVICVACLLIAARYEGLRPYETVYVRERCLDQAANEEQLYACWLALIEAREKQPVPQEDVRDCLKMINMILSIYV